MVAQLMNRLDGLPSTKGIRERGWLPPISEGMWRAILNHTALGTLSFLLLLTAKMYVGLPSLIMGTRRRIRSS